MIFPEKALRFRNRTSEKNMKKLLTTRKPEAYVSGSTLRLIRNRAVFFLTLLVVFRIVNFRCIHIRSTKHHKIKPLVAITQPQNAPVMRNILGKTTNQ